MTDDKNHKAPLAERKTQPVTAPALWLGLIAFPVILGLLAGLGRSNDPLEVTPPPVEQAPITNTRGGGIGNVSASNPIVAPGIVEQQQSEGEQACNFDAWIGQEISEEIVKIIKDAERPYRILPPGSAMTMDHNPNRVNFDVTDAGVISRVWCG